MLGEKYTLGELRSRILKLMERYSSNGERNSCGEVLDIENRLVTSLNVHIRKLWYEFGGIRKRYEFSFYRPQCTFDYGSMTLKENQSFTEYFGGESPGFYIVAGGKGRLVFYTAIGDPKIYTIDTEPGRYVTFYGAVENSEGEACRFLLASDSYIDVKSFVIYDGVSGACGDGELLCGKGTVCARLPEDCSELMSLKRVGCRAELLGVCGVEEEKKLITMPYEKSEGDFVLEYIPYPTLFEEECGDDGVIILPPVMADALCYMCASELCPSGDFEAYSRLSYKYREILENIYNRYRPAKILNRFYGTLPEGRLSCLAKQKMRL